MISKKKEGISEIRPKDLNPDQEEMNWKVFYDGIEQLKKLKLIKSKETKHNKTYYSLHSHYLWQALKIGRQNSDIINLQSFPFKDIINLSTTKGKTTIYGLKSDVFEAVIEGGRNTDIGKKETLEFVQGIKAKELFGKTFGTPLGIKIKSNIQTTERDVIERQREHYLDLVRKNMRIIRKDKSGKFKKPRKKGKMINVDEEVIKDVIEEIIHAHRNSSITFKEAGENFVQKLLELKKKHRYGELEKTYNTLLKNKEKGKTKKVLKEFKEELVLILNHCDISKGWLEETIFKFYGIGRGLYSTSGALADKEKWKRNGQFYNAVSKLNKNEREQVINFLMEVLKENIVLYPTRTTFICRAHSHDTFPEGIPLR